MLTAVLDSHAVDPMADLVGAYEAVRTAVDQGQVEILFTHVTIDELVEISDIERRGRLVTLLVSVGHLVPTGAAVAGFSRLDFCCLSDDEEAWEAFTQGNLKRCRDALIATTAVREKCALVTADHKLAGRAREREIEVIAPLDFLQRCGFTNPVSAEAQPTL